MGKINITSYKQNSTLMEVNLQAVVKKAINKESSFLTPLIEAIKNSLQANATKIDITFNTINQFTDSLPIEGEEYICGYKISDNGEGFTEENIKAFNELYCHHNNNPLKEGCKGYGRIIGLVYFKDIEIESYTKEGKLINIKFNLSYFPQTGVKINNTPNNANNGILETTVYFNNPQNITSEENKENIKADLREIKNTILDKLFIFFYFFFKEKDIEINLRLAKDSSLIKIDKEDFNFEWKKKEFTIQKDTNLIPIKENFILYYAVFKNKDRKKQYLCAHNEGIEKICSELDFPTNFGYIFLLTSRYFDNNVNDARSHIKIPKESTNNLLKSTPIALQDIQEKFLELLDTIIDEEIDKTEQDKIIQEVEKTNKGIFQNYPYLKPFVKQKKYTSINISKAENKYFEIIKNFKLDNKKIKELSEKHVLEHEDKEYIDKYKDEANVVNMALLTQYVKYREGIINVLKTYLEDKNYWQENYLQELILTKNTKIDHARHLYSNAWLLDDTFMNFNYAVSECKLEDVIKTVNKDYNGENKNRVDYLCFLNTEEEDAQQCLLIEFKNMKKDQNYSATSAKISAISQVALYAKALKKDIPTLKHIYAYVISEVSEDFKDLLIDEDFKVSNVINKREIYWRSKSLNTNKEDEFILITTYLNASTLYELARLRNTIFFDILNNKYETEHIPKCPH